ncbi:MAG: protein phosphatase 2C domain-containing protein [Sporichthyaceae bacterium]
MDVGYRSEIGNVRKRNEDALLVEPETGVYAVADGMGGHPAGDVASALVIAGLKEFLSGYDGLHPATTVSEALEEAHTAVLAAAQDEPARRGMGSTAVLALVTADEAWVGHVGDSRCYLLGSGEALRAITADHGAGGYLTQALGLERGIAPDVAQVPLSAGDRLLLCTDGLTNMVDDALILAILRENAGAQAAADALTAAALAAGGVDNVTTVVIDCH